MTKKCNIVPLILHDGKLQQSVAFQQLLASAKAVINDSIEARERAKDDYYSLFTPSYLDKNGDWVLLRKLEQGIDNESDRIKFSTVYNGDIDILKKSIKVSLNEQGEPVVIKDDIDFVFEQTPELASIGTQQQYSQYLDTIFPNSKVKDIVYRGDGSILNKAVNSTFGTGYYFTPKRTYAENFAEIASSKDKGYGLYISLLNLKNPLIYNETLKNYKIERSRLGKAKDDYKEYALGKLKNNEDIPFLTDLVNNENTTPLYAYKNGKYFTSRGREVSIEEIKQNIDLQIVESIDDNVSVTIEKSDLENINEQLTENNDGIIVNIQEKYKDIKNEYIVFEPDQIHILGSKQDIEGFKQFVDNSVDQNSVAFYVNESSEYLNAEDQLVMNRVFLKIVAESFDSKDVTSLTNLKMKDIAQGLTLKNKIIEQLKIVYDQNGNTNLARIIEYLENDEKHIYECFVGYLSNKLNIKLNKHIDEIEKAFSDIDPNDIEVDVSKGWDDAQMLMDLTKTTAAEIKFELAKSVYKNSKLVDLKTSEQLVDGKIQTNSIYTGSVAKYDINIPVDIDDVWNQILSININASNKYATINLLRALSSIRFDSAIDTFIDRLESDADFYNLFYRTAALPIVNNVDLVIEKDVDLEDTSTYSVSTNNRRSKAVNVAYDLLLDKIKGNLNTNTYSIQALISISREFDSATNNLAKYNAIKKYLNFLDLDISEASIGLFLKNNYSKNVDIFNVLASIKNEEDNESVITGLKWIKEKLDTITKEIAESYNYDYGKLRKVDLANVATQKHKKKSKYKGTSPFKGALGKLAIIHAINVADLTSMSYYNSKFDRQQSPQYNSFITDFFNGLGKDFSLASTQIVNGQLTSVDDLIIEKFKDYIADERLDFDNLLWSGYDEYHIGIFEPSYTEKGKKQINKVNHEFISKLNIFHVDGNRYTTNSTGEAYKEIKDDNWNLTNVMFQLNNMYLIPTSDSGRMYAIQRAFEKFDLMIPKACFDDNETGLLYNIHELGIGNDFMRTRLYDYSTNNLKQEFKDIQLTFAKLYNVDKYLNEGILEVNDNYKDPETWKGLLEGIEVGFKEEANGDHKLFLITPDGKPAGSVFNVSNLVYLDLEDNTKRVITNTFEKYGLDYLREVLKMDLSSPTPSVIDSILIEFIGEWLYSNQVSTIKALTPIKNNIVNALNKNNENIIKPVEIQHGSKEDIAEATFNRAALNIFLNNHFNTVIFGNLLFGNVTEFKNMIDWNKRVKQTIANGASTPESVEYRQLVMQEVMLKSNDVEQLDNLGDIKLGEEIKRRYKREIDTSNAINFITDDEYIRRLHSFGIYDRYKSIIDEIYAKDENGKFKAFDPNKHLYLVEQLKYFSYSRKLIDGRMVSIQNKNSTVVLFERTVRGTEREVLYNFMKKNNIHDVNTKEGHKLGGTVPLKLHNDDGTINRDILKMSAEEVEKHIKVLNHKDLRVQLEVVPHIKNKKNTIATQLIKKTLDNLIDKHSYISNPGLPNSSKIKGRTGSFKDGERGVFENLHMSLSENARHSALEILNEFGAIEDGRIKVSADGKSIIVDRKKVGAFVENYFLENTTDYNIIKAVKTDANGISNLPYHHPSILKLIESVFEAKITNNVTRQKIAGSHLTIQPDLFMNTFKAVKDTTNQDTHVTYTKAFLEESDKRGSRKLRADGWYNGKYRHAELVINPFDKKFYRPEFLMDDGSGRVDIKKIEALDPKLLVVFGTRIPHEGDQSSFVGKIVGFLQDGSSSAIAPDHLIARTGWDFDIDTIYLYHYASNEAGKVYDILDNSKEAESKRLTNYIRTWYPNKYDKEASRLLFERAKLFKKIKSVDTFTAQGIEKLTYDDVHKLTVANILGDYKYRLFVKNNQTKIDKLEKFLKEISEGKRVASDDEVRKMKDDLSKAYKERSDKYLNLKNEGTLSEIFKSFSHSPGIDQILAKRKAILAQLKKEQEAIEAETKEYVAFKNSIRSEFDKLNQIEKGTREERNNVILDSLISFHSDPTNLNDREKPNEFDHISSASSYVNGLLGFNVNNAHPTNIADQMYFRNLNMNIATLKESSVAYDNILAILSVLKARNNTNLVSAIMKFEEIKGYDPKNEISSIDEVFRKTFGVIGRLANYTIDRKNKTVTIHNIGFIGNNYSGEGIDIQGQRISEQRSELTANILDAVKKLMVNINQESFGIFAYLASTPLSYYTNIHTSGEAEINRYIYPSLFIAQPIVQDLIKTNVANNREGEKKYSSISIAMVEEKYRGSLLQQLVNDKEKAFEKFLDKNAKSYRMDDSIAEAILETNPKFDVDKHNLHKKSVYKYASEQLEKFKKNGISKNIPTEAINDFLKSLGKQKIASRPYTLEQLRDHIIEGKKNNIDSSNLDHLINQLSVLEYYKELDKASSTITNMMSVLNTDKLGASPNSGTTNNLFTRMVRLEKNYGAFDSHLKSLFGKDVDGYRNAKSKIENNLNSLISVEDKLKYLNNVVYPDYAFNKGQCPVVTIDGESVISAVYNPLFKNSEDYTQSEYPYLAAQAIWTNLFSTRVYNTTMLSEKPSIKVLLNKILSELDSVTDDKIRYRILMYLMNRDIANMDFFKIDYSKILSIAKNRIEKVVTEKGEDEELIKEIDPFLTPQEVITSINPIETFKKLSLANQLATIQHLGLNSEFARHITTNTDQEAIQEKGYVELSIVDNDKQINEIRAKFKRMYNSSNEFDRIVAENIIRYAFINNGLQFGSSISRYIPTDIFYDPKETGFRETGIHKVKQILEDVDSLPTILTEEIIENIHKANWNNDNVNPTMDKSYYFVDGKKQLNKFRPTWQKSLKSISEEELPERAQEIIVENIDRINNSKYAGKDYLVKTYKIGKRIEKVLYKRYRHQVGNMFMYYPINKTMSFEYGSSVIEDYNRNPYFQNEILQESEYVALIENSSVSKEDEVPLNVEETSYTKKVKSLAEISDVVLHIGNFDTFEGKVANSITDKPVLIIKEKDFIAKGINLSKYVKDDGLTILVTGNSATENTSEKLNSALTKMVNENNISKIYTVLSKDSSTNQFRMSIGKILSKSSSIQTEVEPYSISQDAVSFSHVDYAEPTEQNLIVDIMRNIKNSEENIVTTIARLERTLRQSSAANMGDIQRLKESAKKALSDFDPLFPSMDAVSEVIATNKILFNYISDKIDDLLIELSKVQVMQFSQSENYNKEIAYKRSLEQLNDYIFVAEQLISLPIYNEDAIAKFNDDNLDLLASYNAAVIGLHKFKSYTDAVRQSVNEMNQSVLAVDVITKSKNPSYIESIHSYAINEMIKEGRDIDSIEPPTITQQDINRVAKRMMTNNEDISWLASKLDSARDSYITLPDIMGKTYGEVLYRTNIDFLEKGKKLNSLIEKVYKDSSKNFSRAREKWFMNKFVNDEGKLISEFNIDNYIEKVSAFKKQRNILKEKLYEARQSKNYDAIQPLLSELKKTERQLKKLYTQTEIKAGSVEYDFHYAAWINLPLSQRFNYELNNQVKFVEGDAGLKIFKEVPNDEFRSKEYNALSKDEQEFINALKLFIRDTVGDVFELSEVRDDFFPCLFKPTIVSEFKRVFGISKKNKEKFFVNLRGEKQHFADSQMMHIPSTKDLIVIPDKLVSESDFEFTKRALKEINENRDDNDKFANLDEIREYNRELKKLTERKAKEVRNYDMVNVLHNFLDELSQVKVIRDFESTFRLTLGLLASDEFKAAVKTASGKTVMDKIKSTMTGKYEKVNVSGKNTNIYQRILAMTNALYGNSRVNTNTDVALNAVLKYTSLGTMGFNIRSGVKNVMVGYTTMITEALSNEFVSFEHLTKATNTYRKDLKHIIKDLGKEESDNFTSAVIKHFGMIFEDHSENLANASTNIAGKALRLWDNYAYLSLNAGEHFMQFNMLLAMLESHRMFGDIPMSLYDYINDRRLKAIKDIIGEENFKELNSFIQESKDKETNATNYEDYLNIWLNKNYTRFTKEQKTEMDKAISEARNIAKEEFNKLETVKDQLELKDGLIKIKDGSLLTPAKVSDFGERVRKVNHSLHGIYNRIDRNTIQDSLFGELFMQFRKWMRPTFIRWFGAKFGKTQFSEGTGTYRSGAYIDFWRFITTPIQRESKITKNNPLLQAIANIGKGYVEFLMNASYYYHKLPNHERANVHRAAANLSAMAIYSMLLWTTYALLGGDDDKKKKNSYWASVAIYQLSSIQTELFETTPIGWFTFYGRTKRNVMASERSLTDLAMFFYYTMVYPFQDDDQRYYQRGMYKGESKMEVRLKKSLPLIRQINTEQHLGATISYYQMYNPVLNIIGNGR